MSKPVREHLKEILGETLFEQVEAAGIPVNDDSRFYRWCVKLAAGDVKWNIKYPEVNGTSTRKGLSMVASKFGYSRVEGEGVVSTKFGEPSGKKKSHLLFIP